MPAHVIENFFVHEHNAREVAKQEYDLAKAYLHEVMEHRIAGNADHDRRFRDAIDRREAARDRFVAELVK